MTDNNALAQEIEACPKCDGSGYKDHAGFAIDPCECAPAPVGGDVAGLVRRVEYALDMTASAKERLHRRAHFTNHDLRTILAMAALQSPPAPEQDAVERVADAIEAASVGYSITLTKLVDGEAEYTATVDGQPPKIFPGHEEASEYVDGFRRIAKARAALAAMPPKVAS